MAVLAANSHLLYKDFHCRDQTHNCNAIGSPRSVYGVFGFSSVIGNDGKKGERRISRRLSKAAAFWQDVSRPTSIEMEPITSMEELDQALSQAKELSQPIIIDWMANWCRKCIYLKPKLEKLASEYNGKIKFYFVDVNNVAQALVKRGNISKMPTIQLWRDGEMIEEVIGGHKAWLVIDEVKEMIQKHM